MTRSFLFACLVVVAGCGGGAAEPIDAGPGSDASGDDAGPGSDGGPGSDAGPGSDGGPGVDGGTACTPTPGTAMVTTGCDSFELAVITHTDASPEVRLTGRLFAFGSTMGCASVDSVDVLSGGVGSSVLATLTGEPSVVLDSTERLLAHGAPVAALTDLCATDDPARRFDSLGFVVRGRVDGGTFESHCGLAEGGSRWPPAVRVTCHQNVERAPYAGNAMITVSSFMGTQYTSTMLYAAAIHGPGGALTSVDSTIHVIPRRSIFDTGLPLAPMDTTGWTGSAGESGSMPTYSQLQAYVSDDPLGTDLCPPPATPGPDYVPPPVFLARFTGMGEHGAYSTEAFIGTCTRIVM